MVYVDHGLYAVFLLVGVHVCQWVLQLHLLRQAQCPLAQVGDVVAFQGVLVGGVAGPPTAAQVLHGVQEKRHASDLGQLRAQSGNHGQRFYRGLTSLGSLRRWLEINKHKATARPAAAGKAHHGSNRRVGANDINDLFKLALRRLERNTLVSPQTTTDLPGVLLRKKPFGDFDKQVNIQAHHRHQYQHDEGLAAQRPVQADFICAVRVLKRSFK